MLKNILRNSPNGEYLLKYYNEDLATCERDANDYVATCQKYVDAKYARMVKPLKDMVYPWRNFDWDYSTYIDNQYALPGENPDVINYSADTGTSIKSWKATLYYNPQANTDMMMNYFVMPNPGVDSVPGRITPYGYMGTDINRCGVDLEDYTEYMASVAQLSSVEEVVHNPKVAAVMINILDAKINKKPYVANNDCPIAKSMEANMDGVLKTAGMTEKDMVDMLFSIYIENFIEHFDPNTRTIKINPYLEAADIWLPSQKQCEVTNSFRYEYGIIDKDGNYQTQQPPYDDPFFTEDFIESQVGEEAGPFLKGINSSSYYIFSGICPRPDLNSKEACDSHNFDWMSNSIPGVKSTYNPLSIQSTGMCYQPIYTYMVNKPGIYNQTGLGELLDALGNVEASMLSNIGSMFGRIGEEIGNDVTKVLDKMDSAFSGIGTTLDDIKPLSDLKISFIGIIPSLINDIFALSPNNVAMTFMGAKTAYQIPQKCPKVTEPSLLQQGMNDLGIGKEIKSVFGKLGDSKLPSLPKTPPSLPSTPSSSLPSPQPIKPISTANNPYSSIGDLGKETFQGTCHLCHSSQPEKKPVGRLIGILVGIVILVFILYILSTF